MMKRLACLLLLLIGSFGAFAQDVEMADTLRSSGKIYVVVGTVVIVFVGLAIYLFTIDKRLSRLEKEKN
ncbi:CcmD family protein [Mucilaginibacter daejeonensis]|uniref:CcmD family protein n=1 Tax=Mucilaginibacter daejeonensis TaxID=398049 RepID=UPI00293EBF2D|nr:CcmD family protein [Mucilaginibacter daejeonensis]